MPAARGLGRPVRRRARVGAISVLALLAVTACRDSTAGDGPSTTEAATTASAGEAGGPDLVVPIDGRPSAVAYGDGVLWVADDGRGVVHRLDAADGSPLGPPVPVTSTPVALDVGAGRVWVVDPGGTLTGIDAAAPERPALSVPLGGALVDVLVEGDRVWVGDIGSGTVRSVDPATGSPSPPIVVPDGVVRLAHDDDHLWVSGLERTVTPIDLTTGDVGEPVPVGVAPIGMHAHGGELWVANSDADTVTRLGPGGAEGRTTRGVGPAPIEVAVVDDDLWVLEQEGPSLTRYPVARSDGAGTSVALPTRPRSLAVAPAGLWVAGVDGSAVVLVRT